MLSIVESIMIECRVFSSVCVCVRERECEREREREKERERANGHTWRTVELSLIFLPLPSTSPSL